MKCSGVFVKTDENHSIPIKNCRSKIDISFEDTITTELTSMTKLDQGISSKKLLVISY